MEATATAAGTVKPGDAADASTGLGVGAGVGAGRGAGNKEAKARPPAKYMNSPETTLFKKGKNVFGLDLAKEVRAFRACVRVCLDFFCALAFCMSWRREDWVGVGGLVIGGLPLSFEC